MLYESRRLWDDLLEGICRQAMEEETEDGRNTSGGGSANVVSPQPRSTMHGLSPTAVRALLVDTELRRRIQTDLLELPRVDLRHTVGAPHGTNYYDEYYGEEGRIDDSNDDSGVYDEAAARRRDASFERYVEELLVDSTLVPQEMLKA